MKTQFDEGKEQLPGMEQQIEELEKEKRELEVGWCHAFKVLRSGFALKSAVHCRYLTNRNATLSTYNALH